MALKKSAVPFSGTAEQEERLRAVIAEHKDDPGALMPILQKAQDIYGYLPIEVQTIIAEALEIPLEKVYGTVHIAFGTNTSFGGTNKAECHMDGIILEPTLYLDEVKVIENGVFLV